MRISKLLPLICAGVFCAAISVRADDNPDQAAARAALMQKMQDLDSQQGQPDTSSNQPPMPDNQPPASMPAEEQPVTLPPSDETQTQIPVAPPVAGSDYITTNATVAAPMSPTNSATPSTPPISAEMQNANPTNPPPAMTETPMPPATKKPGFFSRIFNPSNRSKRHSAVVEVTQPTPTKPDNAVKKTGFAPIEPPPPPVSPEKEAELHALLQKYEADQITPDQYQTERAEILNSP